MKDLNNKLNEIESILLRKKVNKKAILDIINEIKGLNNNLIFKDVKFGQKFKQNDIIYIKISDEFSAEFNNPSEMRKFEQLENVEFFN